MKTQPSPLYIAMLTMRSVRATTAFLALLLLFSQVVQAQNEPIENAPINYQGLLQRSGVPVPNGTYNLIFTLYDTNSGGIAVAGPATNNGVAVSNGLFIVQVNFGGHFWYDPSNSLPNFIEIAVEGPGDSGFTTLSPRQQITPTPFGFFALAASNLLGSLPASQLSGTVTDSQLANSSITVNAGSGLGGGGSVALGGSVTLNNAGVTSLASGGGVTVSSSSGGVTLGSSPITVSAGSGLSGGGSVSLGGSVTLNNAGVTSLTGGGGVTVSGSSGGVTLGSSPITVNAGTGLTGGGGVGLGGSVTLSLGTVPSADLSGTYGNAVTFNNAGNSFTGSFTGNGSGLTSLNLSGSYCNISAGSLCGGQAIGAASGISIASSSDAFIGGGFGNTVGASSTDAGILGGDNNVIEANAGYSAIAGGQGNITYSGWSFIGGGGGNEIGSGSVDSTIGGGNSNTNSGSYATIAGGSQNTVTTNGAAIGGGEGNTVLSPNAVVGGGSSDAIWYNAANAVISGGNQNTNVSGSYGAIGGGEGNNVTAEWATIPGGFQNFAGGNYSFAAGQEAVALSQGDFVWADDSINASFASTSSNEFLIRAANGVGINVNNPAGASLNVQGNQTGGFGNATAIVNNTNTTASAGPALRVNWYGTATGNSAGLAAISVSANNLSGDLAEFGNADQWVVRIVNSGTIYVNGVALSSDRNVKTDFTPVDSQAVLDKVAAMPISEWNYKNESRDQKHLGPVAQDFHAAFGLNGADDKHISVVDEGGVALAAIQGLDQRLEDEVKERDAKIASLEERLDRMEKMMANSSQKQ